MSLLRCFSSLGCPDLSLGDTLALAQRHGVPAIELRALGGTLDVVAYLERQFRSPDRLAAEIRDAAAKIVAFGTGLHLVDNTPTEREAFLAFIPWADALEVPYMRAFDSRGRAGEEEVAAASAMVQWWRDQRRARGCRVDLMVETHDLLFTASRVRRFLALQPDVKILWDTHHTWKKGGEDPVETWRAIAGSVVHIHIKDSVSTPTANHPFTYVPPGDGEFPIAPLLERLRANKFAGPLCLEWEKVWHPYLGPLEQALSAAHTRAWW